MRSCVVWFVQRAAGQMTSAGKAPNLHAGGKARSDARQAVFDDKALGWIGAAMIIDDVALKQGVATIGGWVSYAAPVIGAMLVVLVGRMAGRRPALSGTTTPTAPVDLARKDETQD